MNIETGAVMLFDDYQEVERWLKGMVGREVKVVDRYGFIKGELHDSGVGFYVMVRVGNEMVAKKAFGVEDVDLDGDLSMGLYLQ